MAEVQENQFNIRLTDDAVRQVKILITERELTNHDLRIFTRAGGCSGLQYGMLLETERNESDLCFSYDEFDVLIDPQSMAYLNGVTIDYIDDIIGGGFHIENPNAIASCGCGNSFRTKNQSPAISSDHDCIGV